MPEMESPNIKVLSQRVSLCGGRIQGQGEDHSQELEETVLLYEMECARNALLFFLKSVLFTTVSPEPGRVQTHSAFW